MNQTTSSYLSIEKAIIVIIDTCATNSLIIVAKSHPRSPNGHGYDFQVTVNSIGITKKSINFLMVI